MANTFDSALVVDTAAEQAITVLQNRLAPLSAFTTDFSSDVVDPLQKVQVAVASSATGITTNPVSFDTGDVVLAKATVAMVHYSAGFGLTSTEINQGHRLERLMRIKLGELANAVLDAAMVPVTTTNFGAAVVSTSASFADTGLKAIFSALKNGTSRALVLDGALYSLLLPTALTSFNPASRGAFGFDGGIFLNNRFSAAGANIKGFGVSPEAIAVAAAMPRMEDPVKQLLYSSTEIEVPDLGISVQFNLWGSTTSRSIRASFDLVFGAALADTSALKLVAY